MILPIRVFGDPILRKKAMELTPDYPDLDKLLSDMFETMYNAHGVGLAAPQIGLSLRLFIVDASPFAEDSEYESVKEELKTFKKVFINPKIVEESGKEWRFVEGCLSIPNIREGVNRKEEIIIEYQDENFKTHRESFGDIRARVVLHEYDHIEGVLFTDLISPLKKKLIKNKLTNMSKGKVEADYPLKIIK